jgi:hypothetical protein
VFVLHDSQSTVVLLDDHSRASPFQPYIGRRSMSLTGRQIFVGAHALLAMAAAAAAAAAVVSAVVVRDAVLAKSF